MSSQGPYFPIAFATLNGTVTINASASPGTTIIQATVPPTTGLAAINVEITDVDFQGSPSPSSYVFLQMFVSGFGLASPVYQNIGHTATAGLFSLPGVVGPPGSITGLLLGNIRWYLPQGAAGVDLTKGGTVGLAAYSPITPGAVTAGASYMVVWGVSSSAPPPPPPPPPPPASGVEVGASYIVVYVHFGGQVV